MASGTGGAAVRRRGGRPCSFLLLPPPASSDHWLTLLVACVQALHRPSLHLCSVTALLPHLGGTLSLVISTGDSPLPQALAGGLPKPITVGGRAALVSAF